MRRQTIDKILDRICYVRFNEAKLSKLLDDLNDRAESVEFFVNDAITTLENNTESVSNPNCVYIPRDEFEDAMSSLQSALDNKEKLIELIDELKGL